VNVASYSGARRAWYAIEDMDGGIRLTIIDDGAPFDPTTAPSPDREFEELDRGGMGIGLVRQLASDVRYRFEGGCNVLVIEISG
jgi:anti-sigma regulatory factor (Ser/Thr protein kinase)